MKLRLVRYPETTFTPGVLSVDERFQCYTLEDIIRPHKVLGESAIPYGLYEVIMSFSPRFKCVLPEVLSVPEFTGIRIHSGNSIRDTQGCVLVGNRRFGSRLVRSRAALDNLLQIMDGQRDITIEITRTQ